MISLKKNESFCQKGDYLILDGDTLRFLYKDNYKGQVTYRFEKFDYEEIVERKMQNTNLWIMVSTTEFTRDKLEKFYQEGKLQELEPTKVAKLKLL